MTKDEIDKWLEEISEESNKKLLAVYKEISIKYDEVQDELKNSYDNLTKEERYDLDLKMRTWLTRPFFMAGIVNAVRVGLTMSEMLFGIGHSYETYLMSFLKKAVGSGEEKEKPISLRNYTGPVGQA